MKHAVYTIIGSPEREGPMGHVPAMLEIQADGQLPVVHVAVDAAPVSLLEALEWIDGKLEQPPESSAH